MARDSRVEATHVLAQGLEIQLAKVTVGADQLVEDRGGIGVLVGGDLARAPQRVHRRLPQDVRVLDAFLRVADCETRGRGVGWEEREREGAKVRQPMRGKKKRKRGGRGQRADCTGRPGGPGPWFCRRDQS